MKKIKGIIFFLVLVISVLGAPHSNGLKAFSVLKPSKDLTLGGKSYLVFIFYFARVSFDYYDFGEDDSFVIWSLEQYGEGSYDVRDDIVFRAQFHGELSENVDFTYQIRGIILSERLVFGNGVEYLGSSKGVRFYFLGIYSGATTSSDFMD